MADWKDMLGALRGELDDPVDDLAPVEGEKPVSKKTPGQPPLIISMEKKGRGGKTATIIEGFLCDQAQLEKVAAEIKKKLGTGGSARGGEILIQGDRRKEVAELLRSMDYKVR